MVAPKKRITTDLLHIALVLALLRGDARHPLRHDLSYHYINELNYTSDHILGPSWAYTQARFHYNMYDNPNVQVKGVPVPSDDYMDEDFENAILNEIRAITLRRLTYNLRHAFKAAAFQDVTAYLVSNTTNVPLNNNGLIGVSDSRTSSNSVTAATTPASTPPGSPRIRNPVQNENSTDSLGSYENNLVTENDEVLAYSSSGFQSENDEESPLTFERHSFEEDNICSADEVDIIADLDASNVRPEDALAILFNSRDTNNWNEASSYGSPSLYDEGAIGFDPIPGPSGDLAGVEFDSLDDQLVWEGEDFRPFDFSTFKEFADCSEEDMMNLISPYAMHRLSDDEDEGSVSGIKSRRSSSHGDPASRRSDGQNLDEEGAAGGATIHDDNLGELWETDSGIFDLIDSSTDPCIDEALVIERLQAELNSPEYSDQLREERLLNGDSAEESNREEEQEQEDQSEEERSFAEMIQTAPLHTNARPTPHSTQPRAFQVHARMPALLRGSSMDQRWQELASLLSLQPQPHDGSGAPLSSSLPHHFAPHHHHHHHHHPLHHTHPPPPIHHNAMHHPPFTGGGPPASPYNTDSARSVLLQNATLPPPDLNVSSPYANVGMGPPLNLGSAVASSMHLTNSSDPMHDPSSHYKMMEPSHDMLYYPNASSSEMSNQTTEGFLSSILNDDDLLDMAMNEGLYTMRPLENSSAATASVSANIPQSGPALPHTLNCGIGSSSAGASVTEDRMEASSDSAVSSMGSERIPPMTDPPMSDTEWADADHHAHASHDSSPYSLDYPIGKLRGYEYYGKDGSHRVAAPVAQKKHQMFGKRFQQEQGSVSHPYALSSHPPPGLHLPYPSSSSLHQPSSASSLEPIEMKYSCSVDFARHHNDVRVGGAPGPGDVVHSNHTYSLPPTHSENNNIMQGSRSPRGPPKEKPKKEHLSRDEKRARSMSLPMTTDDIINLPMDEFNERLSKFDLTETQLSLIRDIRRRGKNKVAAQNCRKRKLDQIHQLEDEVQKIRERKQSLKREQDGLRNRRDILKDRYGQLYRTVFQALRDPDGSPYSHHEYSLQQSADGNIVLVPRNLTQPSTSDSSDHIHPGNSSRRDKSKDDVKKEGQS